MSKSKHFTMPTTKSDMMLFLRAYINNNNMTVNGVRDAAGVSGIIHKHLNNNSTQGFYGKSLFKIISTLDLCFIDQKKRRITSIDEFRNYLRNYTEKYENSWKLKDRANLNVASLYAFLRHKNPADINTVNVVKLANALHLEIMSYD